MMFWSAPGGTFPDPAAFRWKTRARTRPAGRENSCNDTGLDENGGERVSEARLTHLNERGEARMVDVSRKEATAREAVARGRVTMSRETVALIEGEGLPKGDVLAVARIAGIMAAKRTAETIPMCHPIPITGIELSLWTVRGDEGEPPGVEIEAVVRTHAVTGVEMEALAAVSGAALTVYDMCKSAEKGMTIDRIRLVKKTGGIRGDYVRPGEEAPSSPGEI